MTSTQYETYHISTKRSVSLTDTDPTYGTVPGATTTGPGEPRKGSMAPPAGPRAQGNGYHAMATGGGVGANIVKSEEYGY